MNLQMLKSIIKREKRTYSDCANVLGVSIASFQRKANGQQPLFLDECENLGNYLGMTDGEKIEVFLRQEGSSGMNEKLSYSASNTNECALEIAKVLEKHSITIGRIDRVLSIAKEIAEERTPVRILEYATDDSQ